MIMVAGCCDGAGGDHFFNALATMKNPEDLLASIQCIPQAETTPDQWEVQILARILAKYRVILVSDVCDPILIKRMGMEHAFTLPEAIARAQQVSGLDARFTVIPDGVSVIVKSSASGA